MKDWTGNKVSVHHMLGVSKDGSSEREQHDFYATEPKATTALIENFLKHTYAKHYRVWEPACGIGNISEVLLANGYDVVSTDLIDRGFGKGGIDLLKQDTVPDGVRTIITNPPYRYTNEFIKHAYKILPYDGYLCLLLNINQLAGQRRYNEIYKRIPPDKVLIFSGRIECAKNGNFTGKNGAINYGWFIWRKDMDIPTEPLTTIEWI